MLSNEVILCWLLESIWSHRFRVSTVFMIFVEALLYVSQYHVMFPLKQHSTIALLFFLKMCCWNTFNRRNIFLFEEFKEFETGFKITYKTVQDFSLNLLKPNDIYICRTTALTSRHYILNIYSTNIHTEYFKHAA